MPYTSPFPMSCPIYCPPISLPLSPRLSKAPPKLTFLHRPFPPPPLFPPTMLSSTPLLPPLPLHTPISVSDKTALSSSYRARFKHYNRPSIDHLAMSRGRVGRWVGDEDQLFLVREILGEGGREENSFNNREIDGEEEKGRNVRNHKRERYCGVRTWR
jgi:hypothetical protein